jgi:hypothetical protein
MSVIDSGKIVEILFDNSEEIPNNIYLNVMNMMKRHHEFGDNEQEIREYLLTIDKKYIIKFEKYLSVTPGYCECKCPDCCNFYFFGCRFPFFAIFACIATIGFVGGIAYCIISKGVQDINYKTNYPPPLKN